MEAIDRLALLLVHSGAELHLANGSPERQAIFPKHRSINIRNNTLLLYCV